MKNKETIEVSKKIDAYIRGLLSKSEIDELWLQFLKNPYYYELFETELHLRNLTQKNRNPGGLIIGRRDRIKSTKQWVMAAVATIIVILSIQYYITDRATGLDTLALTSISYTEMAAGNVDRADDENTTAFEADINRAMAAAYMSKEDESIEMFRNLKDTVVNKSQRVRIEYNMAILYYNRSEFELARDSFLSVTISDEVDEIYLERAWWFLANTYLKMNEKEEAMEAIQKVKLLDGINSELASTLLDALNKRG